MTLEGFAALDREQKMNATMAGTCVGGRTEGGYMVLLYQMKAFYIEVWYNKIHHFISDMVAFDCTDRLAPYLDKISLQPLLAD